MNHSTNPTQCHSKQLLLKLQIGWRGNETRATESWARALVSSKTTVRCTALRRPATPESQFSPQVGSGKGSAEARGGLRHAPLRAVTRRRAPPSAARRTCRSRALGGRGPEDLSCSPGSAPPPSAIFHRPASACAEAPSAPSGAGCLATAGGAVPTRFHLPPAPGARPSLPAPAFQFCILLLLKENWHKGFLRRDAST